MRIMPFHASDVNLTFSTKDEADNWSMEAAKEWCDRNFPDWPIQRFEA